MIDRELLELAASAAGIASDGLGGFYDSEYDKTWSPLSDDGDALRLAVKLGIDVFPWQNKVHDQRTIGIGAATRLAIVRAAAEIGKIWRPSQ